MNIEDFYGVKLIHPEMMVRIDTGQPPTRLQRLANAWREEWNEVLLPSLLFALAFTALTLPLWWK